ncbi:MAG: hypothetical protein Ct9H300mP16_10450 [Pseudomonadota bacterium]|nr:MAG: hypothetical protein Ct9H300mP16_10450 [Pseudomonadota bacterium]
MLRIEKLSVAFGGVEALAGLDLEVQAGTVLGLIGPNGSGKTTLFNVLTGVYPADRGRIYLGGKGNQRLQNRADCPSGCSADLSEPALV